MSFQFTSQEISQIEARGMDASQVEKQFSFYEKGFPFINLAKPATLQSGIFSFTIDEIMNMVSDYSHLTENKKIVKFVPASGAASRMFKTLFAFLEDDDEKSKTEGFAFLDQIRQYAFFDALKKVMLKAGYFIEKEIEQKNYKLIITFLLDEKGLNYKNLPKALLKFHHYIGGNRLALEEHLVEAALYAKNSDNTCNVHFTLSPTHIALFEETVKELKPHYEERFNVKYKITHSIQDPATDTLAATVENEPFQDDNGELLFRPAGHGALIYNVNRLDADLIFIKNIDNVITENGISDTVLYKKLLASILIKTQQQIYRYLTMLDSGISQEEQSEIIAFLEQTFFRSLPDKSDHKTLRNILNRPLRVCGMVKNEGEPGGGPFFIKEENNQHSLQIIETAQMNLQNIEVQEYLKEATHFNPVDLVCSIKDYQGKTMDLLPFVDPQTGFIAEKSYNGRTLKAMELPGLWNGAMAKWNTIFVEVPLSTFNPVKTIFDLGKSKRNNDL